MGDLPHIAVCICTYQRAAYLKRLLDDLGRQETESLFSYSIVVADNDAARSAEGVVTAFAAGSLLKVTYCVQPEQNIALTRNEALSHATGDFIAFIDDDEFPKREWLSRLFQACQAQGVDGVLGPVKPFFEYDPPRWLLRGRFCERPEHETGYVLNWRETRTGNVLFKRAILSGLKEPFQERFRNGGEDDDFFRRRIAAGCVFIWCNQAIVYEAVPRERCTRRYLLKRALLRGQNQEHYAGDRGITKSICAVGIYLFSLPFLLLAKHHILMKYLIRLGDHIGKLLAFLGWKPMGDRYITN
jgi:succinoglycan biosynthesis protein ExoM